MNLPKGLCSKFPPKSLLEPWSFDVHLLFLWRKKENQEMGLLNKISVIVWSYPCFFLCCKWDINANTHILYKHTQTNNFEKVKYSRRKHYFKSISNQNMYCMQFMCSGFEKRKNLYYILVSLYIILIVDMLNSRWPIFFSVHFPLTIGPVPCLSCWKMWAFSTVDLLFE